MLFNSFYLISLLLLSSINLMIFTVEATNEESIVFPLLMPNVQPTQKETYLCTAFRVPSNGHHIVEFIPNATMETAHHILIYGCKIPGYHERDTPRIVWDCGEMFNTETGYVKGPTCAYGSQIVYAWAKNAPQLVLPEGVGFKIGTDSGIDYLVLQVHYANVDKFIEGGFDNSGIALKLLPESTQIINKRANVYFLGTGGVIPQHSIEHMEVACLMNEPLEIHPFAFRTHSHNLGRVISAFRISPDGGMTLIGRHNPQRPQMFYPVKDKDLVIRQNDVVAARCTMQNNLTHSVEIGPTGNDEMCNFYMMYYVKGDRLLRGNTCYSRGPPLYYWSIDGLVSREGFVPKYLDFEASRLSPDEQ